MFHTELSVSGVPSCGDVTAIYEVRLLEGDRIKLASLANPAEADYVDEAEFHGVLRGIIQNPSP